MRVIERPVSEVWESASVDQSPASADRRTSGIDQRPASSDMRAKSADERAMSGVQQPGTPNPFGHTCRTHAGGSPGADGVRLYLIGRGYGERQTAAATRFVRPRTFTSRGVCGDACRRGPFRGAPGCTRARGPESGSSVVREAQPLRPEAAERSGWRIEGRGVGGNGEYWRAERRAAGSRTRRNCLLLVSLSARPVRGLGVVITL